MAVPRSSAVSVPYDLRPSKQIERRIMLDVFAAASRAGVDVPELRYVGMGGVKYVDFIMFHRYLGIKDMVSLEHAPAVIARSDFNRPYGFIKFLPKPSYEYLKDFPDDKPYLFWRDYDWGINPIAKTDIADIGRRVPPNSFLFSTISAEPKHLYEDRPSSERFVQAEKDFGVFTRGLTAADFEEKAFRTTAAKLLFSFYTHSFAARGDGVFLPILCVEYKDTSWMATVGGFFGPVAVANHLKKVLQNEMPFLNAASSGKMFRIFDWNVTDKERGLFERAATSDTLPAECMAEIKALGFNESDVEEYAVLLKYLPRYHEAFV